ncbi:MAG: exodeoxyribonuclease VII large subunit [Clostridia bacterium]|nr:exodeoxyribonuclease VII large subunit [Clostridia bacterium]
MNIYGESVSVSALNGYIKQMMERDDFLSGVAIRGEISNFKRNISGHLYFSLKDDGAAVSAVMFRSAASRLTFLPSDGMQVTIYGRVSVYEKTGQYQIYAETMVADGIGELARAYEAMKRRLEAEGLFAEERKKPLPKLPRRVGIITSPTGAAIRDMLNVTGRRYPLADILIFPAAVQGAEAPLQLTSGIGYFNAEKNVNVIIIGRGGGSIEDLWAFNDEGLVRAVAASEIPVISAVGHETDFTLCDFAADKRAPTPSAAAELAVPDKVTLQNYLSTREERITRRITSVVNRRTEDILNLEKIITRNSPVQKLENSRREIVYLGARIENSAKKRLSNSSARVAELAAKLTGMNPMAVLARGYGAIESGEGRIVNSASRLGVGENIGIIMSDGRVSATVTDISITKKTEKNKKELDKNEEE